MSEKENELKNLKEEWIRRANAIEAKRSKNQPQRLDGGRTEYSELTDWYRSEISKIEEKYDEHEKRTS